MTSEPSSPLFRVRNWDALYENNRSRDMKQTSWFPAPNDLSSDNYVELVANEHGAAHFGVWNAVLMVASRAKPRRGLLVKEDGRPHTAASLARVTRLPEVLVKGALDRLLEIGLLEVVGGDSPGINNPGPHPGAGNPQDPARKPQEGAVEGKGTEHHHHEGKRKGRKRTRTELQGTEGAPEESTLEHSEVTSGIGSVSLKNGFDDDEQPTERYASPDDELKAIYQAKAGEPIAIDLLDAIRVNLECASVSMGEFVEEVKKHARNKWRNPPGFLRDLSTRFRAKTRAAGPPVTAAEAEARSYRCPACHSRTPGEGAILRDGQAVPCVCASPEYIARQRERKVFAPEPAQ